MKLSEFKIIRILKHFKTFLGGVKFRSVSSLLVKQIKSEKAMEHLST